MRERFAAPPRVLKSRGVAAVEKLLTKNNCKEMAVKICSTSVAIGVISIAVLIYTAVEVSRTPKGADAMPEVIRRRNMLIAVMVLAAVGIVFASGRLGYVNLKGIGIHRASMNPRALEFRPKSLQFDPKSREFYPADYIPPVYDASKVPIYTSM